MIKKMILLVVAILLMGASMTGCSVLEKGIDEYSKDKEECVLNTDNVTQFTYKGDSFTILDDTLSNSELGERKKAIVTQIHFRVLLIFRADASFCAYF